MKALSPADSVRLTIASTRIDLPTAARLGAAASSMRGCALGSTGGAWGSIALMIASAAVVLSSGVGDVGRSEDSSRGSSAIECTTIRLDQGNGECEHGLLTLTQE
jgi:hypothetical protein